MKFYLKYRKLFQILGFYLLAASIFFLNIKEWIAYMLFGFSISISIMEYRINRIKKKALPG